MAVYNKYSVMPYIPYNVVQYLATHNENIWKILKYPTYDCLSKPDLTLDEKMELIWKGETHQDDYSVFFSALIEDMIWDERTILKVHRYYTVPKSNIFATALYEFDILYGGKIALIDYNGYPCNRGDVMEAEILSTLNGKEMDGVGVMEFNAQKSNMSKSMHNIGDNKQFTGQSIIMAIDISDVGEGECW